MSELRDVRSTVVGCITRTRNLYRKANAANRSRFRRCVSVVAHMGGVAMRRRSDWLTVVAPGGWVVRGRARYVIPAIGLLFVGVWIVLR